MAKASTIEGSELGVNDLQGLDLELAEVCIGRAQGVWPRSSQNGPIRQPEKQKIAQRQAIQ